MSPRLNRVVLYFNKGGGGAHKRSIAHGAAQVFNAHVQQTIWFGKLTLRFFQRFNLLLQHRDAGVNVFANGAVIATINKDVAHSALRSHGAVCELLFSHIHSLTADKPGRCSGMGLGLGLVVLASDVDGKPNHHDNKAADQDVGDGLHSLLHHKVRQLVQHVSNCVESSRDEIEGNGHGNQSQTQRNSDVVHLGLRFLALGGDEFGPTLQEVRLEGLQRLVSGVLNVSIAELRQPRIRNAGFLGNGRPVTPRSL